MLSLKKLRNALREELSMREFFTSPVFNKNFEDVAKMVSARYKTPIYVSLRWDTNGKHIAYTDNRKIYINLDNSLVSHIDKLEDRYSAYLGLLGHELGHVLYTDFNDMITWRKSLLNGNIYGKYDSVYQKNAEDLLDYMKKTRFYGYVFEIVGDVANCIEDRFVNEEICREFSGTFNTGIKRLHKIQYANPTELAMNPITDFLNAVLHISILEKIPDGFEKVYPGLKKIKEILKDIPKKKLPEERLELTNNVFLEYWPVIKLYAELHKDEAQNAKGEGDGEGSSSQGSNSSNSSASKATKSSQVGKGTGIKCSKNSNSQNNDGSQQSNTSSKSGKDSSESSKDKSGQNKKQGDKDNSSDEENLNGSSGSEKDKNKDGQNSLDSESGDDQDEKEGSENSEDNNQGEKSEDTNESNESDSDAEDTNESDNSKDDGYSDDALQDDDSQDNKANESDSSSDNSDDSEDSSSNSQGQEVSADVTFNGDVCNEKIDMENIEKVIDGLVAKIAKEMLDRNPERAERILANKQAQEIVNDRKSCHKGYKLTINTVSNSNDRGKYERAAQRLSGISRRLQKRVLDVLEEQNDGGVCKNLLKGNKVNPAASASNNGRIFKRNTLPDRPELAVCVLIDQSGSMWGERIEKALEMAIIIEDFCSALDIPVQISGHCDSCGCQIYDYIRFDDNNKNRKYRLTKMFSSGCNRDGLALKYCENNILERDEDNKLLIIISDGRPNSDGYYGSVAESDLRGIKKHFEKSGGRLIAAAIGEDKDTIKRIYQDSFMDITDLSQLPIKMIKVISSYFA